MMPSYHSASALPETSNDRDRKSDLPDCLRDFHARRRRGIMVASKRESSKQCYALPPAFHSCLERREGDTSILDQGTADPVVTAMTKNDDHKKTSVQRVHHNIHRKRTAWKQMALRNRHEANPHHQEMLQILKEAAQRARASNAVACNGTLDTSGEFIPIQALLNQVQCKKTFVTQENANAPVDQLDLETAAALRLQACYRGFKVRSTPLHHSMQQGTTETSHQDEQTLKMCLHGVSFIQPPKLEREVSNITMSDLGDSTHHSTLSPPGPSKVNRSRSWIEEGIDEDHSDTDDDVFIPEELVRCRSKELLKSSRARMANKDSHCRTAQQRFAHSNSTTSKRHGTPTTSSVKRNHFSETVSGKKLPCSPRHHSSWSTMATQFDVSTEEMRLTKAMGYASLNSYFGSPLASDFSRMNHQIQNLQTEKSRSQNVDDFIDQMLEGDDDDDDASCVKSFFDEESRVDKFSLPHSSLHRSEGSLDLCSTLQRRVATFRHLNGTISTSCFHLSLSSTSRWDDGLPHPTSLSHLHPKDQLTISKAAVSTFLPVRQPPRKLSPHNIVPRTNAMGSGRTNNSPRSTIFSSTESTEPSPTMPLRKASSHGTAHLTVQTKNRGRSSYKSSIPVPPLTRHDECRISSRGTLSGSSSPQLPIRKISSHNSVNHCPQGLRTLHSVPGSSTGISATATASTLEDGPIRQPQRKLSSFPPED